MPGRARPRLPPAGRLLRRGHRADLRRDGGRRRAHLPLDQGHQLRHRRDGRLRRRPPLPAWSSTGTCPSGCRSPPASSSAPSSARRSSCSIVRRLFTAPRVILLVALIGAAQVLLFMQLILPDADADPSVPDARSPGCGRSAACWCAGEDLTAIIVIPLLVLALTLFLNRTKYGLAIRASAANADAARLVGHQHQADVDAGLGRCPGVSPPPRRCSSGRSTPNRDRLLGVGPRPVAARPRRRAHRPHGRPCRSPSGVGS